MTRPPRFARRALQTACVVSVLALTWSACGGGTDLATSDGPLPQDPPSDSTPPPTDTLVPPPDTTTPPPTDTLAPPPDTTTPPPPSGPPPAHAGIPIGPAQEPVEAWTTEFNSTVYVASPATVMEDLAAARRLGLRIFVSFTGSSTNLTDGNGFSIDIWKRRMDRFRKFDFTSYINDGTIIGHFLLDEPSDPSNWNGKVVPQGLVEVMAEYSKEAWPTMTTMIRAWPDYLKGGNYPHLDAVRVQYHVRFGDIDDFIKKNAQEVRALGLSLVGGLNVTKGGGTQSGLPPYEVGRYPMNATQVRTFGSRYLSEPSVCGFVLWDYRSDYFERPEIKAAMADLSRQAANLPNRPCKHQ